MKHRHNNSHPLWDLILVGVCSLVFAGLLFYLLTHFLAGWWS